VGENLKKDSHEHYCNRAHEWISVSADEKCRHCGFVGGKVAEPLPPHLPSGGWNNFVNLPIAP
jgi:hypothetical protein